MNRGGKTFWGIVLVALGILMILNNLNLFSFSWIWGFSAPALLFLIAFFFVAGYVSKGPSSAGLLVPAGILAGVGVTLLLGSTFGLMPYVWPGFILSPAIGLFLLYAFGNERNPGLLVPIGILGTVAATCFFSSVLGLWHILWPGFILSPAVGLLLLYLFGERHNKGLLIPVGILGGISFFAFSGTFLMGTQGLGKYILAGLLIFFGVLNLMKKPDGERAGGKRWGKKSAGHEWKANEADEGTWEEDRSREEWRDYGQQAYREYDETYNNPEWARTDAEPQKDNTSRKQDDHDGNPYVNSDYSRKP